MNYLLPINYIYQINANLNIFYLQFDNSPTYIHLFKKTACITAYKLAENYNSCQFIAILEKLSKYAIKKE